MYTRECVVRQMSDHKSNFALAVVSRRLIQNTSTARRFTATSILDLFACGTHPTKLVEFCRLGQQTSKVF